VGGGLRQGYLDVEQEDGLQPGGPTELVEQLLVGLDLLGHGGHNLLVVLAGRGHRGDDHRPDQLHSSKSFQPDCSQGGGRLLGGVQCGTGAPGGGVPILAPCEISCLQVISGFSGNEVGRAIRQMATQLNWGGGGGGGCWEKGLRITLFKFTSELQHANKTAAEWLAEAEASVVMILS